MDATAEQGVDDQPGAWEFSPQHLRMARVRRGFSRPQLAMKLGLRPDSIKQWENGDTKPRLWIYMALCGALGVEPNDLAVRIPVQRRSGDHSSAAC